MTALLPAVSPTESCNLSDPQRPVLADISEVETPHRINPHRHERGQLVYASNGSLQVKSSGPTFMVPNQFALWIPPGVEHSVTANTAIRYCSLFVDPSVAHALPPHSQLLHITTLFKELTQAAANGDKKEANGAESRLNAVLLDQIHLLQPARVALPMPASERLHPMVAHYMEHPDDNIDMPRWATELSMSVRTLTRVFKQETGLTLGRWLQHLKVLKAIELLERGEAVKTAAYEVGFQQPSAFIVMFRKITGQTPSAYISR